MSTNCDDINMEDTKDNIIKKIILRSPYTLKLRLLIKIPILFAGKILYVY
jgi:hypothetical protein